jgi:hypothetical protein
VSAMAVEMAEEAQGRAVSKADPEGVAPATLSGRLTGQMEPLVATVVLRVNLQAVSFLPRKMHTQ